MKTYKRNNIWWLDTTIDGKRYRISLETTDWRRAQTRSTEKIHQIKAGKVTRSSVNFARLRFEEAAKRYLASRKFELKRSSLTKEQQSLKKPTQFFEGKRLSEITAEDLNQYRDRRAAEGVGPVIINLERGMIRKLLKRAKRWQLIADEVAPLKEPNTIGRPLSPEQKFKLLETARQRPDWETACWAAVLALNTTMRGCELKALRWLDVDLLSRMLTIPESKTEAGKRTLPLTDEAYKVLVEIRERASLFGSVEPKHYIFAAVRRAARFKDKEIIDRRYTCFDPTRPVGGWRTAWRNLTKEAGIPGLRFHDLRHHAITELCEAGVPEQTIKAIAGHVSNKMLERYSHPRIEAKRAAMLTAFGSTSPTPISGGTQGGYDTNYVTNLGER